MDEKELVNRIKAGDENAFESLIDIYGPRLLKTIFLIIRDEEETKDIFQETFLKVHKNIRKFKGKSSLYTWIYSIAINESRDRFKRNREATYFDEDIFLVCDDVEEQVIDNIHKELVRKVLNRLPPIYREVLVLFYFDDMSIKEICEVTGEKEGTIKSKLSRGRNILKKSLVKEGFCE